VLIIRIRKINRISFAKNKERIKKEVKPIKTWNVENKKMDN